VLILALQGAKVLAFVGTAYLFSFIYIQVLGCVVGSKTAAARVEAPVCLCALFPHRTRPREYQWLRT
jgi:hypothetical protein